MKDLFGMDDQHQNLRSCISAAILDIIAPLEHDDDDDDRLHVSSQSMYRIYDSPMLSMVVQSFTSPTNRFRSAPLPKIHIGRRTVFTTIMPRVSSLPQLHKMRLDASTYHRKTTF